jgi:hypothetical protein
LLNAVLDSAKIVGLVRGLVEAVIVERSPIGVLEYDARSITTVATAVYPAERAAVRRQGVINKVVFLKGMNAGEIPAGANVAACKRGLCLCASCREKAITKAVESLES